MNAQFSLETERLAFAVRPELGEEDGFVIYPVPRCEGGGKITKRQNADGTLGESAG